LILAAGGSDVSFGFGVDFAGGKAKPLKQAKVAEKDYDEVRCPSDLAVAPDSKPGLAVWPCNSF
jgi:hypothetical protein